MNSKYFNSILNDIPNYPSFLKVNEIEKLLPNLNKNPLVKKTTIGKTVENQPLNMFTLGTAKKTAMIIGVPHSDEPLGSLVTQFLINWMITHPQANFFGWRWIIIPILEQRGMKLNEGWFKNYGSIIKTAKSYFREPTENQYEWTFPFEYKNYQWLHPRPESIAVREIIKKEKPDLLCNLHHCGFYDTYFYFSKNLPIAIQLLRKLSKDLNLPLSTSSPDVPFGKLFSPGFYKMYGLKDYIDYYKKHQPEKLLTMRRGSTSDEWYKDKIGGFSFNCEVPIIKSSINKDDKLSNYYLPDLIKTRNKKRNKTIEYSINLLSQIEPLFPLSDSLILNSVLKYIANAKIAIDFDTLKNQDIKNRKATNFEVFENDLMIDIEDMLLLGQIWQVVNSIQKNQQKNKTTKYITKINRKLLQLNKKINQKSEFKPIPIKKLIKMQLASILIIADVLLKK